MAGSRSVSELGFKSTYLQFIEQEGIPVHKGFFVKDIRRVELAPWNRVGGLGAYLNLEGSEGVNDAYVCEIPPGKSLNPQKHLFEELVFVVSGHGATSVWKEGGRKQTFEWQEGSLFSPPLNTWHQHFNGQGDRSVRLLSMTNAPTVMNLFHNLDFIFNCPYEFTDRYDGSEDYFSGKGTILGERFWDTNFIRDVRSFELKDHKERGAGGKGIMLEIANNLNSAHISQFPVGTYKKAHRHGPGAHVIILTGNGYSFMWQEGKEKQRFDWGVGSLFVPPEMWFHQHFNVGGEPVRYLALKPFTSRKFPGLKKHFGTSESVKTSGNQIEYEDEDPRIRQIFEEELARNRVTSRMAEVWGASAPPT
jgi:quercetin dioxygenase-like cupin family protein